MPSIARFASWLAAAMFAVCATVAARAQSPPAHYETPTWPDQRVAARNVPPAAATQHRPPSGSAAPRLLSPQQVPPRDHTQLATRTSNTQPVAANGPLPLPPRSGDAPAPQGPGAAPPWASVAMNLGLVLGLFLVVAWALRRGGPKGSGLLPSEALTVLGRAQLAGRQQVYLVRCGNKLVLVSPTPSGVEALTEITDPAEVQRLQNLCHPGEAAPGSWRQFFSSIARTPRSLDLHGRETLDPMDFRHLDAGEHYTA